MGTSTYLHRRSALYLDQFHLSPGTAENRWGTSAATPRNEVTCGPNFSELFGTIYTARTSQVHIVDRERLFISFALLVGLSCSSGFVPWRGPLGLRAASRRRIRNGERETDRERERETSREPTDAPGKPSTHSSVASKHFKPDMFWDSTVLVNLRITQFLLDKMF